MAFTTHDDYPRGTGKQNKESRRHFLKKAGLAVLSLVECAPQSATGYTAGTILGLGTKMYKEYTRDVEPPREHDTTKSEEYVRLCLQMSQRDAANGMFRVFLNDTSVSQPAPDIKIDWSDLSNALPDLSFSAQSSTGGPALEALSMYAVPSDAVPLLPSDQTGSPPASYITRVLDDPQTRYFTKVFKPNSYDVLINSEDIAQQPTPVEKIQFAETFVRTVDDTCAHLGIKV